jgi:Tol biopolymer transport system component
VSWGGRYVVFNSNGSNMPRQSDPPSFNVYRRDLVTGKTRLVSTTPSGDPNHAYNCAATGRNVSGNGRYAVYYSTFGAHDDGTFQRTLVYLWDARTGKSRLVSKVLGGKDVKGSYCPSISLDGSRVALVSRDPLVPEDTNRLPDVYVYDVATRRIQRVSVTSAGKQTYDLNYEGREFGFLHRSVNLSADGRFVVFDSSAPELAPSAVGSTRHPPETTRVFLHDLLTGATVLVSVSSTGEPLGGNSHTPYISADGSAVAFMHTGPSGLERVMVHELSFVR